MSLLHLLRQLRHNPCGIEEILLGHPRSRLSISPKTANQVWPFKAGAGSHPHITYTQMDETGWQWGWWLSSRMGVRTNAWSCCFVSPEEVSKAGDQSRSSQLLHNLGEDPPIQPSISLDNYTCKLLLSCLKGLTCVNPMGSPPHLDSTFPHSSHHSHKSQVHDTFFYLFNACLQHC